MPWKGEKDPYKIWLSEIILQQTRVAQGLPYFNSFIQKYPTLKSLAVAEDEAVFKLWEGLGYYSRCRNLLACSRQILTLHNGIFPNDYESILGLKGVGPYTAAAIASFAFDMPYAVVDGNVNRVLSRYFGIHTPIDSTEGKKLFYSLAGELLVKESPAAYNQAIMDFGATVCTPADPSCDICPLSGSCTALEKKQVKELPVKSKKLVKRTRYFTYFIIRQEDKIIVRQRVSKDIWQQLYEFYLVESESASEWEHTSATQLDFLAGNPIDITHKAPLFSQKLTHQNIYARFIEVDCRVSFKSPVGYQWKTIEEIDHLAFPRIINSFRQQAVGSAISLF